MGKQFMPVLGYFELDESFGYMERRTNEAGTRATAGLAYALRYKTNYFQLSAGDRSIKLSLSSCIEHDTKIIYGFEH